MDRSQVPVDEGEIGVNSWPPLTWFLSSELG